MRAEIICVGTELLLGDIVNTNARFIAQQLSALGISVYNQQVVGDNPGRLEQAAKLAKERSDIVLFTGGLGPTDDDLTKQTVASVYNDKLVFNQEVCDGIERYFLRSGRQMTENNRKQAYVPARGRYLKNDYGTAPGIVFIDGEKLAILMPGVPREMIPMMENQVMPMLAKLARGIIKSDYVRVIGIGESALEERIKYLLDSENPTMALYAKEGEVTVRITANASDRQTADEMLAKRYAKLDGAIHNYIYGVNVDNIETVIVRELAKRGQSVATAESCTGGTLSGRITSVPGASEVFSLGMTTYSDRQKHEMLGVPPEELDLYTAVSSPVACSMARGALLNSGADYAIATTGYRGPGGGTPQEPVGTVYIAVADSEKVYVKKCFFNGERARIVHLACQSALDLLRCVMNNLPREGVRVIYNRELAPVAEEKKKPKGGFFKKLLTVILLLVLAFILALGYLWFKNSGQVNIPNLNIQSVFTVFQKKGQDPARVIESRKNSDFFAMSFENDTIKMLNKLMKTEEDLEGWLTFKNSKSEYPVYARRQDDNVHFMAGGNMTDYVYIGGFDEGNFFNLDDLDSVRENAAFVMFDDKGYTDCQIFSVGTFSRSDLAQLADTTDKEEYIVNIRARSLYDVDTIVTKDSPLTALVQDLGDGKYMVAFAVKGNRGVIPSVDIKSLAVYSDWYMQKNGLTDENAAEAMLYAQEVYDRDNWAFNMPSVSVDGSGSLASSSRGFSSGGMSGSLSGSQSASGSMSGGSMTSSGQSSQSGASSQSSSSQSSSSQQSSQNSQSSSAPQSSSSAPSSSQAPSTSTEEILTVTMNGQVVSGPASQILSQIVAIEMTSTWSPEALKAQAIATHTYLEYEYARGVAAPAVSGRTSPARAVTNAVSQVSDLIMTVGGSPINAVYCASVAGRTNPASQVWGTNYSYLQSVESKYDYMSSGYEYTYTFSLEEMKKICENAFNITLDEEDAENWFSVVDYTDGGYIRRLKVGDATTYVARNGNVRNITGYWFASEIMADAGRALRSAAFTITYNDGTFTIVTKGYGHGAGMSQWGAQFYAVYEGWDYRQILTHYYTGVSIQKK